MRGSGLSDYLIAILELLEAEGRSFKKEALKVAYSLGFILVGMGLLLLSFAYFLWAFNAMLLDVYTQSVASFMTAGLGLGISLMVLGLAKWKSK